MKFISRATKRTTTATANLLINQRLLKLPPPGTTQSRQIKDQVLSTIK
jgi:hypothetical protein